MRVASNSGSQTLMYKTPPAGENVKWFQKTFCGRHDTLGIGSPSRYRGLVNSIRGHDALLDPVCAENLIRI